MQNKKKRNKICNNKAQQVMGLSFGVIFSMILIVFFIAITFYIINKFMYSSQCAQLGLFIDDLRSNVNNAWNSQKDDFIIKKSLPKKIEYVCFADMTKPRKGKFQEIGFELWRYKGTGSNALFYPAKKACQTPHFNVEHLDMEYITSKNNPYCKKVKDGIIELKILKGYNDRYVKIK